MYPVKLFRENVQLAFASGTTEGLKRLLAVKEDLEMSLQSYRELKTWQLGMEIAVDCYRLTKSFPREELFGLFELEPPRPVSG